MKILMIGSGGREHALIRKLMESPRVEQIYCAPGNGGISRDAQCVHNFRNGYRRASLPSAKSIK